MSFPTFNKAHIQFTERELVKKYYTVVEILLTTKYMKIINKKKFMIVVLNVNNETFVLHVATLAEPIIVLIYSFYQAQVALLTSKKLRIHIEYSDFSDFISSDSVAELLDDTRIINHFINLLDNKQLPYSSIYSLGLVKLELLKTYIRVNLANSFIKPFKSPTSALILYFQKRQQLLPMYRL